MSKCSFSSINHDSVRRFKAILILFQCANSLVFSKTTFYCHVFVSYFSPADKHLDVKKTSFKKLSKFLKEMEKAGYIKVKELSKGVESITEMKKDHPEWVIKEYNFVKMALNSLQYSFISNKFSEKRSHLYMMNMKTHW